MKILIRAGLLCSFIFAINCGFSQNHSSDKLDEFVAEYYYESLTKTFEFLDEMTRMTPSPQRFNHIHFKEASFPEDYELVFSSGPKEKKDGALKSLLKRLDAVDFKLIEKKEIDAAEFDMAFFLFKKQY